MFTEILRFDELDEGLINRWHELINSQYGYESPFFQPHFSRVVSRQRGDIFVIVHGEADQADFILPIQKHNASAHPVGAPFSDYHGPIMTPAFGGDIAAILSKVGLSSYHFTSLYDPRHRFESYVSERDGAFVCNIGMGADAYFEEQRLNFPRHAKKLRRLKRKIEREVGEVVFDFDDRDPEAMDLIIEWKRKQYQTTGRHDVLAPQWVRGMLKSLWDEREPGCQTLMHTLKHEGRLVAGEFNLIGHTTVHGWIPSFDHQYWSYSPGYLLQDEIIQHAADQGFKDYDLGVSAGHYKKYYANFQIPVLRGSVRTGNLNSRLEQTGERLWRSVEDANLPKISALAGKVRRRYGMISTVETSFSGRMRGLALAAGQIGRKSDESEAPQEENAEG